MIRIFLVFVLLLFPSISFAGQYELIEGKGVEVCEAYGKNLNSFKPIPRDLEYQKYQRRINPEIIDLSMPDWSKWKKLYPEDSQKLFDKIDRFIWERDINPLHHLTEDEKKIWLGTQEEYAKAWERYKINRRAHLVIGLFTGQLDIDNDGIMENVSYDTPYGGRGGIFMVLNTDKTDIDAKRTEYLLRHPVRKTDKKRHYDSYGVLRYKNKTYFEWWEGEKYLLKGVLHVFIIENQSSHEMCKYVLSQ